MKARADNVRFVTNETGGAELIFALTKENLPLVRKGLGELKRWLEKGKTLVVDELDSSLHFRITRAIVALFNNELNTKAQLVFTLHDISLLDCKTLFRKDQIWFAAKDSGEAELYSLDEFSAQDGTRADTSDIAEQYRKGMFGAIPDPDLIGILLGKKRNESD